MVTGRSKAQLSQLLPISGLFVATSQGFEISGPNYQYKAVNEEELSCLRETLGKLEEMVIGNEEFKGVQLENKEYNIAVHYRNASDQAQQRLFQLLESLTTLEPRLALHHGKKVFEIRPNVPWHKGKAVKHLMSHLNVRVPVYIGDDLTDEDAFRELEDVPGSVTVLVAETAQETRAKYRLRSVVQVMELLAALAESPERSGH